MHLDFETNQKFFDKKHRKKVRLLRNIGTPLSLIGAIMLAVSSIRPLGLMFLMRLCWIPLIIGVPILAVAMSLRVKETDILDIIDDQKREFKKDCEEKLDYPGDLMANSMQVAGSVTAVPAEGIPGGRRLKSDVFLTPLITLSYLYIRRDRVVVFTRRFSLCEDFVEDKMQEILLSDLDGAGVVQVSEVPNTKAYAFRITNGEEALVTLPVFTDDYTEQEFAEKILHTKARNKR